MLVPHGVRSCIARSQAFARNARWVHLTRATGSSPYDIAFKRSIENPTEFWAEAAENITWFSKWNRVLDASNPIFPKWFVGATMNTCYNCVDRHVEQGRGKQEAIVYDSPVTNRKQHVTYAELLDVVGKLARVLIDSGVQAGDRVIIYMPAIPQAIFTMLACARIGAIHSLVFGGFAARELASRIEHANAKLVVTASCGIEGNRTIDYKKIVNAAIGLSSKKPQRVIVYQRPGLQAATLNAAEGDLDFEVALRAVRRPHDAVPVNANAPLYVLYTSGTTGAPKGVVRANGGHAVALSWSHEHIYGVRPRCSPAETWWAASDLGWVVGHSYICYAPLLNGVRTVLFEGKPVGTPDASAYFRVLAEHDVVAAFTAPTALRAIRKEDPNRKLSQHYELPKLRTLFVAGEHCDTETQNWAEQVFQRPILDHYWQTETGWPITATCSGLNMPLDGAPPASAGRPVPGFDVRVIRDDSSACQVGELGSIVVKLPLPPGCAAGFYNNDELYAHTYFKRRPGFYETHDAGTVSADGYISILSRTDDVINVAGHRLSTSALEEALLRVENIVDAAVVGVPDSLKGQLPLAFVVLRGANVDRQVMTESCVKHVREEVGPVAVLKRVLVVSKLPKTRSGKTARASLAKMAAGQPFRPPVTIEDPAVYDEIGERLREAGFTPSVPSFD